MTDAAPAIFAAIEGSALAAAIRQSPYAYMVANVGHILSLMIFFAAVAAMDLRLAGVFAATSPHNVLRRIRSVAMLAFAGIVASGAVLFMAEASHVILNRVFQLKLGLIALGLLNVAWFEFFVKARVMALPPMAPLPQAARVSAIASLAVWLAVATCGRLIAYF